MDADVTAGDTREVRRLRHGGPRCGVVNSRLDGPDAGVSLDDRLRCADCAGARRYKTGVAVVVGLALVDLTQGALARLPCIRVGGVDVHDTGSATVPVESGVPVILVMPAAPVAAIEAAAVPIKIVAQPRADKKSGAECEHRRVYINDLGIVLRNEDHLGIRRHDADGVLLLDHFLLRGVREIAGGLGLFAQCLNRAHHIGGLLDKRLSDRGCPIEILVHPCEHVGISGERFHALVPRLVFHLPGVAAGFQIPRAKDDIRRHRGSRKDECDQRVGIKRDRSEEPAEFLGVQFLSDELHGRRNRLARNLRVQRGGGKSGRDNQPCHKQTAWGQWLPGIHTAKQYTGFPEYDRGLERFHNLCSREETQHAAIYSGGSKR